MDARSVLIVLDRDGVLNRTVPNPAEPRPDSPMHAGEVSLFPWVPSVLRALTDAGFGLVRRQQPAGRRQGQDHARRARARRTRACSPKPSATARAS